MRLFALAVGLEILGIAAVGLGIGVGLATGAGMGHVLITGGGLLVACGGVLFGKFLRR